MNIEHDQKAAFQYDQKAAFSFWIKRRHLLNYYLVELSSTDLWVLHARVLLAVLNWARLDKPSNSCDQIMNSMNIEHWTTFELRESISI